MEKGVDYKLTKLEKGPLQRFKNQNLLLKKFGELGLQVYKAITGKRTAEELRGDLDINADVFAQIISYMEQAGMVELTPIEVGGGKPEKITKKEAVKEDKTLEETEAPEEEVKEEPEEEIKPVSEEEKTEEELPEEEKTEEKETEDFEIKPIGIPEESKEEDKTLEETEAPEEEVKEEPEEEIKPVSEEEKTEEELPEEEKTEETKEEIEPYNVSEEEEEEELSPVEKIIRDKYGDVGIKVYTLIDGQKTAEEIMKETGLTESKLVEILDFMDEEGIIKLEYPGEKKRKKETPQVEQEGKIESSEFKPILDEEQIPEKEFLKGAGINPVEVPIKTPSDIVQSLYLRTNVLLKLGEKGGKIFDMVDGKNDSIELALKSNTSLHEVLGVIEFMLSKRGVLLTPLSRADIRRKYGDEGYSVYKKYGREGLMLYELVGHDLRIGDMAKKIYKDPKTNVDKIVEMFLFIHQILKIDLPVDKDLLYRELTGV